MDKVVHHRFLELKVSGANSKGLICLANCQKDIQFIITQDLEISNYITLIIGAGD